MQVYTKYHYDQLSKALDDERSKVKSLTEMYNSVVDENRHNKLVAENLSNLMNRMITIWLEDRTENKELKKLMGTEVFKTLEKTFQNG